MAVHFKFKSAREFDKLDIEGPFITVSSLKDKIIEAKNLGKGADFDLVLTNNQTGEGEHLRPRFLLTVLVILSRVLSSSPWRHWRLSLSSFGLAFSARFVRLISLFVIVQVHAFCVFEFVCIGQQLKSFHHKRPHLICLLCRLSR